MTDASASEAVYVSPEELLPFIDAMNIDLKGFDEAYYRKLSGDLSEREGLYCPCTPGMPCGADYSDCAF